MNDSCQACRTYRAELERHQRKIDRLEKQLRQLRQAIKQVCNWYIQSAQLVLSQRSGVPRGRWAFWRGVYQVAVRVLALLNEVG